VQAQGALPHRPAKRIRYFRNHVRHAVRRHPPSRAPPEAAGRIGAYFGFPWDEKAANAYLDAASAMLEAEHPAYRLRLAINPSGAFAVQHAPLAPLQEPVRVLLAEDATKSGDLFLRHKTSIRARYDAPGATPKRKARSTPCSSTNAAN
jgi:hypothetical protein